MSRFAGWAFFLTISVSHDRQDEKRGTGHAVVAVRHEQHWPVLDNRTMVILDAENVRDYRPPERHAGDRDRGDRSHYNSRI